MSMTITQAKSEALRLAHEGKAHASIAEHLKAKGYTSKKTGKPLSPNGVSYMLNKAGHYVRKRKSKAHRAAPVLAAATRAKPAAVRVKSTEIDRLTAVKSILSVSSMDASERIAFALLMIG